MTPEILAPAGCYDSLRAALHAGADAVYFGVEQHNARARASNFTTAGLRDLLQEVHDQGCRGYLTLNTLVFDDELEGLKRILERAREARVDAIIVQDVGVARLVRQAFPELTLHASTQMTCTDPDSVALAASLGARRVVLARELSLSEIRTIRAAVSVELEVFVHGALCISYSGQCLTSEAIGGRSANRGACAQACRLPYTVIVDGHRRDAAEQPYLLSPQDLDASALIPELMAAGVSSFKIEGRLKGPEYVAATIRLYRAAIAAAVSSGQTEHDLSHRRDLALQTYSRGSGPGFLEGTNHQALVEGRNCAHRGLSLGPTLEHRVHAGHTDAQNTHEVLLRPDRELRRGDGLLFISTDNAPEVGGYVWTLQTPEGQDVQRCAKGQLIWVWLGPQRPFAGDPLKYLAYRSGSVAMTRQLNAEAPYRRPLRMLAEGAAGGRLTLSIWDERGVHVCVESEQDLRPAHGSGLSTEQLRAKLGRLGGTPFYLDKLTCRFDAPLMLAPSELNRLRRAAVAELLDARSKARGHATPNNESIISSQGSKDVAKLPGGLFVLVRNAEQACAALEAGADGIYLDFLELTGTGATLRDLRAQFSQPIGVCPPRIRKPAEEKIEQYLRKLEPDFVLVRTLGLLNQLWPGPRYIGDFSLNVANTLSAEELLSRGLHALSPAHDLNARQLECLASHDQLAPALEVIVHHPMPFFHMEHCLFAALLSSGHDFRTCGRPCEHHTLDLEDRTGARHPLEADVGCRNTLFRGTSQSAAQNLSALQKAGVRRFRIECLRERSHEVHRLVSGYRRLLSGLTTARALRQDLASHGLSTVRGSLQVV